MKKYLKQRIEEMKKIVMLYEIIVNNATSTQEYEEALKTLFYYKGGIEELEVFCEEFDIEYDTKR